MDAAEALKVFVSVGSVRKEADVLRFARHAWSKGPEFAAYKVESAQSGLIRTDVVRTDRDAETLRSALLVTGHRVRTIELIEDPSKIRLRRQVTLTEWVLVTLLRALEERVFDDLKASPDEHLTDEHEAACYDAHCDACAELRAWRIHDALEQSAQRYRFNNGYESVPHEFKVTLQLSLEEWGELLSVVNRCRVAATDVHFKGRLGALGIAIRKKIRSA
jgi:hypothetical protein